MVLLLSDVCSVVICCASVFHGKMKRANRESSDLILCNVEINGLAIRLCLQVGVIFPNEITIRINPPF
jgi:hypothetical protein